MARPRVFIALWVTAVLGLSIICGKEIFVCALNKLDLMILNYNT